MLKGFDILFWILAVLHLATRQWPYGDTLQTVADVTIGLAAVLTAVKYWVSKKA